MDFSTINKKSSDSFAKQRTMLKKLAKGQTLYCEVCKQALTLEMSVTTKNQGRVSCQKGCTDILLELA